MFYQKRTPKQSFYQELFFLGQYLLMTMFHNFNSKNYIYENNVLISLKSQMLREYVIRQSIQQLNQHNFIIEYFHCSSLSLNVYASLQVTYLQSKTFHSNILTQNSTYLALLLVTHVYVNSRLLTVIRAATQEPRQPRLSP